MNSKVYSLPFDQFQRYSDLSKCVETIRQKEALSPLRLLDVGGYPGLAADFVTTDSVTILDVKPLDEPNYIQGDACAMPVEDESFDIVTALDVFEHIAPERRDTFLEEVARVATEYIIIGGPFHTEEVSLAEKLVFEFCVRVLGDTFARNHPLQQHLEHGLPQVSFVTEWLEKKGFRFVAFPSGQLYNWLLMNLVKNFVFTIPESDSLQKMLDTFYNQHFSARDYGVPSYRTFFFISKRGNEEVLGEIETQNPARLTVDNGSDGTAHKLQLLNLYFTLFELEAKRELKVQKKYSTDLERMLSEKEQGLNNQKAELNDLHARLYEREKQQQSDKQLLKEQSEHLRRLQKHADNLEASLAKIKQTIPYKLYKKVIRRHA